MTRRYQIAMGLAIILAALLVWWWRHQREDAPPPLRRAWAHSAPWMPDPGYLAWLDAQDPDFV